MDPGSNEGQTIKEAGVGHSRKRLGQDGNPRYTAYYDDLRGQRRSAGTHATRRDADAAWQRAEVKLAEGRIGDPWRGRQRLRDYVEEEWFPNHRMEATTRQNYRSPRPAGTRGNADGRGPSIAHPRVGEGHGAAGSRRTDDQAVQGGRGCDLYDRT